jgi:Ser/Thr protein kinase RdoA (MazF antagonist)
MPMATAPIASFHALTPDRVLDAVEAGGLRTTGRCLPLRAFENRVYEVELEDRRRLVVKFYRPGRWSRETILDEHRFLDDLVAAEVPAVAPIDIGTGRTLNEAGGIFYAAFPKIRGRTLDELDAESRRRIGRTIGRMHAVGAARPARHRRKLDLRYYIHEPLAVLLKGGFMPENLRPRYRDVALRIAEAAAKPLAAAPVQRIHGDLHWGNILWTPDPVLVDFDDCMMGPPVQDLWLLARGDDEDARKAREDLIEGYEVFREFDRSTLVLAEPLRAMRIVYMSGWIARRWDDPSFPQAFPAFTETRYWMQEYEELVAIAEALA